MDRYSFVITEKRGTFAHSHTVPFGEMLKCFFFKYYFFFSSIIFSDVWLKLKYKFKFINEKKMYF